MPLVLHDFQRSLVFGVPEHSNLKTLDTTVVEVGTAIDGSTTGAGAGIGSSCIGISVGAGGRTPRERERESVLPRSARSRCESHGLAPCLYSYPSDHHSPGRRGSGRPGACPGFRCGMCPFPCPYLYLYSICLSPSRGHGGRPACSSLPGDGA